MKVEIENTELVIRIPLIPDPQPSSTGKSIVVASTAGFTRTDATIDGKPISLNVCAIVKP